MEKEKPGVSHVCCVRRGRTEEVRKRRQKMYIMSKREKLVSEGKMVLTHEKRVSFAIFSKMG